MQLAATPELGLAVHNDLAAGDWTLGVCTARGDSGELVYGVTNCGPSARSGKRHIRAASASSQSDQST
jgi:hypothetical protein